MYLVTICCYILLFVSTQIMNGISYYNIYLWHVLNWTFSLQIKISLAYFMKILCINTESKSILMHAHHIYLAFFFSLFFVLFVTVILCILFARILTLSSSPTQFITSILCSELSHFYLCVSVLLVLSWYWFIRVYHFIYERRLEIQLVAIAIVSIIPFYHIPFIDLSPSIY